MKVSGDLDVQKEDQLKINTFSRLNMQFHEKTKQLNEKKEQQLGYEDALDEMELMNDDEKIQYKFGDCFFKVTIVQARDMIARQIDQIKKTSVDLNKQIDEHKKSMMNLKAKLYAKFGNQINLDED